MFFKKQKEKNKRKLHYFPNIHFVVDKLRMRESYKRFVNPWIRFTNPWIRIDLKVTNPDLKRFDSYPGSQILI